MRAPRFETTREFRAQDESALQEQLQALQLALRSSEAAKEEYRRQVESNIWSFGDEPSPFVQNVPCIAFMKDAEGRYSYVNNLWEESFGRSFDDWYGRTDQEIWPEPVARRLRANDAAVAQKGRPHESVDLLPTGAEVRYWLVTRFPLRSGMVAGVGLDITERKLAEDRLRESDRRYRDLFENTAVGMYRADAGGRVTMANPALVQMLGVEPWVVSGGSSLSDFDCRTQAEGLLARLREAGGVKGYETRLKRADGAILQVRHSANAVADAAGNALYYDGLIEDITAIKQAAQLEKARTSVLEQIVQNESLREILDGICRLLEGQIEGANSCVMLRKGDLLLPESGPSLPPGYMRLLQRGLPVSPYGGSCGAAVYLDGPVAVRDISESDLWRDLRALAQPFGLRSCWSIPIRTGVNGIAGSIAVYQTRPVEPDASCLEMLDSAAQLAAIAIEHRDLYEDLQFQARYDRLTGLPNRTSFEDELTASIDQARLNHREVAILWIDLDRFKQINDSLGHRIGDVLLLQVGQRLAEALDGAGMLARMGGDEFAVLLPEPGTHDHLESIAQRLLTALDRAFEIEAYELFVGASIGVAVFPESGQDSAALMRNVDTAMYRAKSDGRNRLCFFKSELHATGRERLDLEIALRHALGKGELELYYQPQVDTERELAGFEALVRWNHPQHGLLGPDRFIKIAEETGLIIPIGRWVIREAARQCVEWWQAGLGCVRVSVNVSPQQFYYADFDSSVRQALQETGFPPESLELELTESTVVRDFQECRRQMEALRGLGIGIAIDDFGTGYSTLSQLDKLPITRIKIDRSFLATSGGVSGPIIAAIANLAHVLGLSVVMEGVETEEQFEEVARAGVDLIQGFLIGHPVPANQARSVLADNNAKGN